MKKKEKKKEEEKRRRKGRRISGIVPHVPFQQRFIIFTCVIHYYVSTLHYTEWCKSYLTLVTAY